MKKMLLASIVACQFVFVAGCSDTHKVETASNPVSEKAVHDSDAEIENSAAQIANPAAREAYIKARKDSRDARNKIKSETKSSAQ